MILWFQFFPASVRTGPCWKHSVCKETSCTYGRWCISPNIWIPCANVFLSSNSFLDFISRYKSAYDDAPKGKKKELSERVLGDFLEQAPCRFLKREANGWYFDVLESSRKEISNKVFEALRVSKSVEKPRDGNSSSSPQQRVQDGQDPRSSLKRAKVIWHLTTHHNSDLLFDSTALHARVSFAIVPHIDYMLRACGKAITLVSPRSFYRIGGVSLSVRDTAIMVQGIGEHSSGSTSSLSRRRASSPIPSVWSHTTPPPPPPHHQPPPPRRAASRRPILPTRNQKHRRHQNRTTHHSISLHTFTILTIPYLTTKKKSGYYLNYLSWRSTTTSVVTEILWLTIRSQEESAGLRQSSRRREVEEQESFRREGGTTTSASWWCTHSLACSRRTDPWWRRMVRKVSKGSMHLWLWLRGLWIRYQSANERRATKIFTELPIKSQKLLSF